MKNSFLLFSLLTIVFSCTTDPDPIPDDRDGFVGSYLVKDYSSIKDSSTFTISVTKSPTIANELIINNIYNQSISVVAVLNNQKVTFDFQKQGNYILDGYGTFTDSTIQLVYDMYLADTTYFDGVVTEGKKK